MPEPLVIIVLVIDEEVFTFLITHNSEAPTLPTVL
jgi:hypothetical protein